MFIETLTHHGLGKAADGTLVPRTLPGEEVEVGEDGAPRILEPSSARVSPPCRHFKSCGGCMVQHAEDDFVARWKTGIVETALRAQGHEAEIAGIETSPPQSRRRAKLSGRRTKKGAIVGFHARASETLIEIPDCRILSPGLKALIPALEEVTKLAASRKGEVDLHITESEAGPDLHILTGKELTGPLRAELAQFAQRHGLARLVWDDEPVVTVAPPLQTFGRGHVAPPPGAFLQATREGEAALQRHVLDGTEGAGRVADLFAGCGTFSLPLAERAEVHAVEGFAPMLEALDRGWRHAQGLKRVTTEARDLFRRPLQPDELNRFDAVVLDPPRAGAEAQCAELAASGVDRVVMASCNPVTFARDARLLTKAGFTLGPITVIDQFRWAPHVELIATLTRS